MRRVSGDGVSHQADDGRGDLLHAAVERDLSLQDRTGVDIVVGDVVFINTRLIRTRHGVFAVDGRGSDRLWTGHLGLTQSCCEHLLTTSGHGEVNCGRIYRNEGFILHSLLRNIIYFQSLSLILEQGTAEQW